MITPILLSLVTQLLAQGWVEIPAPTEERLRCVTSTGIGEWRVALEEDKLRVDQDVSRRRSSGPPLAFPLPDDVPHRGDQHTLAVSDGFLVGFDAGEWGGQLLWLAADGRRRKLADDNVHG